MQHEQPHMRLERESAERQKLVDLAYSTLPPPPAGIKRVMWFGDSDTPMPIDIPESVVAQMEAISAQAFSGQATILDLPSPDQQKAMRKIRQLAQPYIDTQYPTLLRKGVGVESKSWWSRIFSKCGFPF